MPFELETAAVPPGTAMPAAGCQATNCPLVGVPLFSTRAWVDQVKVEPAAMERVGVSAVRMGAAPPVKCAWTLAPLVKEAMTTAGWC